jgi:hypothetical protein
MRWLCYSHTVDAQDAQIEMKAVSDPEHGAGALKRSSERSRIHPQGCRLKQKRQQYHPQGCALKR